MKTLTYPGDATHMVGEVKGPTHMRELVTAVAAETILDLDDDAATQTRVTFSYGSRCCECFGLLAPDDLSESVDDDVKTLRIRHPGGVCPA